MTLTSAAVKASYRIRAVNVDDESAMGARFRQLGFVPGITVSCEAIAPLLRHPLLVQVRGMQVALSLHEAALIEVEDL